MRFVHESVIPASVREVFAFHERPDAFALLQAPWAPVRIHVPPASLQVGTVVELETKVAFFWVRIVAEHVEYEKDRLFVDVMREGPFAAWRHRHVFEEHPGGCLLRDEIEYQPPLGFLGRIVEPFAIRPKLRRLFAHRHAVTREMCAAKGAASS